MYKIIPKTFKYNNKYDLTQVSMIMQTDSSIEEIVIGMESLGLFSTQLVSEIFPNSAVWNETSYGIVQDV